MPFSETALYRFQFVSTVLETKQGGGASRNAVIGALFAAARGTQICVPPLGHSLNLLVL